MIPTIPGRKVSRNEEERLRNVVRDLLSLRHNRFPGAQPVSLNINHLRTLEQEDFFVCEKTDGARAMMLMLFNETIREHEAFLIDRKNMYYRLQMKFPREDDPEFRTFHTDTIIDGEVVIDVVDDEEHIMYLTFDCLVINGKDMKSRPLTKRLGYLREYILKPYYEFHKFCRKRGITVDQPVKVQAKNLEKAYGIENVLRSLPYLRHKSDGLIFTSAVAPYTVGTDNKMLKWKAPEENTVDFVLQYEQGEYCVALSCGKRQLQRMGRLHLTDEEQGTWKPTEMCGKIIECRYDPHWEGRWRFVRIRRDKDSSNHISTYHSIMESIRDGVSKEQLLDHCPTIRARWKQRNPGDR